LDFGGGTLISLSNLPHVGSVAGRMDGDRVRRTVAEITGLLRERELRFRDLGIESMRDFRQRKAQLATMSRDEAARDPLSEDKFGDVVLVVDGWARIRSDFELLEPATRPTHLNPVYLRCRAQAEVNAHVAMGGIAGAAADVDPVTSALRIGRKWPNSSRSADPVAG
jgi:S-DNA-T family DNA segregation ATPase FtsK/SpoIIIE